MEYIKDTKEDALKFAAEKIKESIDRIKKDIVVLGVPGGRSVAGIFKYLRKMKIDWKRVHIFMVDERMVSLSNKDCNFLITQNELLKYIDIPKENVHPFNVIKGINKYEDELVAIQDNYDIILLSSGEDGHIGALYPNHHSIKDESDFFLTMDDSPKLPKERMTMSKQLIRKSHYAIIMFLGKEKRQALANFNDRYMSFKNCPAKLVKDIPNSFVIINRN